MEKWLDTSLPFEERADALIAEMTIKEKAAQMIQLANTAESEKWAKLGIGSIINAYGEDVTALQNAALKSRLKIPVLFSIDCIHGHALNQKATIFPSQLAMAQSFNPNLLECAATVSGTEALCDNIPFVLSPVLCLARDPRWGRVGETFGEDPYLSGELGAAMVSGYSKANVLSCAKHYVAHAESIGGRDSYEVPITPRKVEEFFDPPFRKAMAKGVASVMTAQHVQDGLPLCQHKEIMTDLLRKKDSFKGFVITDNCTSLQPFSYGTAKTKSESYKKVVEAGSDMLMFCSKSSDFYDLAEDICKDDTEFENKMNIAVKRILLQKFKLGLFENPFIGNNPELLGAKEHIETALKVSRESITLLKNNGVLPIDKKKVKTIAVIGPAADNKYSQYGDWTYLNMPFSNNNHTDETGAFKSYLDAIKEFSEKENITVNYAKGAEIDSDFEEFEKAESIAKSSDIIIAVVGDLNTQNGEHHDRSDLSLSGLQQELLDKLLMLNKPIILVYSCGKPLLIKSSEQYGAILQCFNGGIMGGVALAEILFGITNPSGKLPISIPLSAGTLPCYYNTTLGWHAHNYLDADKNALYPFGFGLSYTDFEIKYLNAPNKINADDKEFKIQLSVKNTGDFDGATVVQVYIYQKETTVLQPVKALKGFKKIWLESGQEKEIKISILLDDLIVVTPELKREIQKGKIEIMVGFSSRDEDLIKLNSEIV